METHAAYCASKSGLAGMTCAVALEGAPFGVNCIAISPTWVETEMLRASAATMADKSGHTREQEVNVMAESMPQKRLCNLRKSPRSRSSVAPMLRLGSPWRIFR